MSKHRHSREAPEKSRKHRINTDIHARKVRLISEEEEQLGVVSTRDAIQQANEKGLDLVEVAPSSSPPVCKMMDYGKFLYSQKKKQKTQDAANRHQEDREIRLRPASADHDLETKAKKARQFLENGCKVKLQIRLRGRERRIANVEKDIAERFASYLQDVAKLVESGNSYTLVPA